MDAIECIKTRRSVRHFNNEPVKDEGMKTILECAQLAPSGHNRQPWEFFITKSKEKLERLSEVCRYGKNSAGGACFGLWWLLDCRME